jgi:hypothetical protein
MLRIYFQAQSFLLFAMLTACSRPTQSNLPPLLQNITAGGGWGSACPPCDETEAKWFALWGGKLGISPEFSQRLQGEYPPGSDEEELIQALKKQGFRISATCKCDQSIRIAEFYAKGEGFLPYSAGAHAFWKRDNAGRIIWTKGFVFYEGL